MERKDYLSEHLKRFFTKDPKRRALWKELRRQGVSKAEVFRQVADGNGKGNSHSSGKPEGDLKGT